MLSIGWTEMMLVAAVALIVVGPKDLPAMLRQIGKAVGSIRRMGNDFKAELNKVTAVDELKDIKQSIAAPLTDVRRDIEKEFNSLTPEGKVVPSGKIAPSDPDAQSVADEIKAATGLGNLPASDGSAAKASMAAAVTKANKPAGEEGPKTVRGAAATPAKSARKSGKAGTSRAKTTRAKATRAKTAASEPATAKKTVAKKPAAKRTSTRKPAAKKPVKSESS